MAQHNVAPPPRPVQTNLGSFAPGEDWEPARLVAAVPQPAAAAAQP